MRKVDLTTAGTIVCVCGAEIPFLPEKPASPYLPPFSVNHAGCPQAQDEGETLNLLDHGQVKAFYQAQGHEVTLAPHPAHQPLDATPAAVAHGEATGVDLRQVEGTGAGGRITKSDVTAADNAHS